jgi:hypothetical protein
VRDRPLIGSIIFARPLIGRILGELAFRGPRRWLEFGSSLARVWLEFGSSLARVWLEEVSAHLPAVLDIPYSLRAPVYPYRTTRSVRASAISLTRLRFNYRPHLKFFGDKRRGRSFHRPPRSAGEQCIIKAIKLSRLFKMTFIAVGSANCTLAAPAPTLYTRT